MITIDDGKHYLVLSFKEQNIAGEIICEADEDARCHEEGGGECAIKRSWENVGMDMLAESSDNIRPKFPIKWRMEGGSIFAPEDWEDWIEVIGPAIQQRPVLHSSNE